MTKKWKKKKEGGGSSGLWISQHFIPGNDKNVSNQETGIGTSGKML